MSTLDGLAPRRRTQLLAQLNDVDLGDWSGAVLRSELGTLGWSVDPQHPDRLSTGLPTGDGVLVARSRSGEGDQLMSLRVPVAPAAAFADLLAAATELIGYEPPMIGDPGPWARWRRAPRGNDVPGTSIGLVQAEGAAWIELTATHTWEDWAAQWFEWGEGVEEVPYRWLAFNRHPSLHGLVSGGRIVSDWAQIERGLAVTFDSLLDGVEALAGMAGPPGQPSASVRLTTDKRTLTAFVDVALRPGRHLELRRAGPYDLGSIGWHRLLKRTWLCEWSNAGAPDCAEAAGLAAAALRLMGVGRPRADEPEGPWVWKPAYARPRFAGRHVVDIPGFGFGRSRSNR